MSKIKRLAQKQDVVVEIQCPVTDEELLERQKNYNEQPPNRFATKFRSSLFQTVKIKLNGKEYEIQVNTCANPFCKNFGLPQKQYEVKSRPRRYKLELRTGSDSNHSFIRCNPDLENPHIGAALNCTSTAFSNWAVAEEIKRLSVVNSVVPMEPEYQFHKEGCGHQNFTPFLNRDAFRSRGKSTGNSQKYQCKTCMKITNVLPTNRGNTTYRQKRNDIVPLFAELLINRIPVNRSLEILNVGTKTYYHKLEWLYKRCLEFLERHESKLQNKTFNELWINTDKMIYYLNNVRKKNKGSKYLIESEETRFQTNVVISSDSFTRYVFRADVAYDWDIKLDDIIKQTVEFKDDHLHSFAQRYGHLRFPFAPQPPAENDTQTEHEFRKKLAEFTDRMNYIDGLHINSTYTTVAHLWHIKQLLNVKEWRFTTDEDKAIITSIMRVFSKEFRLGDAHHFLYKVDKTNTLRRAIEEYVDSRAILRNWAISEDLDIKNVYKIAPLMLEKELMKRKFHKEIIKDGKSINVWANNPIVHPLPFKDTGYFEVDCTTDLSSYEPLQIAKMILKVNNKSTDTFINQIRRRISILERPLVTSRGDGKSYIYSNFNPKYAQYAITILRTYYNFCKPTKIFKTWLTPAQRLGIAEKVYDWKDIIYLR